MKTFPVINLSRKEEQTFLLRELIRQNNKKMEKILFISPPKLKSELPELISEKESKEILEKLKRFNKEFFGK